MKKCLVAVLFLLLAIPASFVYAQDATTVDGAGAGSKAMLFTFSGLNNLGAGDFNGGFGAKFYLSDPLAVRASLMFAHSKETNTANPVAPLIGIDGYASGTRLGLSAAAEYHLLKARVSPYVGGGLGFSTAFTESAPIVVGAAGSTQTVTKNSTTGETIYGSYYAAGTNFNAGLLCGVEFFVIKEISLSAEYQLGFGYTSRSDEEVVAGAVTTKTKVGSVSELGIASTGYLTLGIYF